MEISNELKNYIEQSKNLIISNNWDKVFQGLEAWERSSLSEFLLSLNINFLPYLKNIWAGTFTNLHISNIKIPKQIRNIEKFAFSGCTDLTSVTFEEGSQLIYLQERAFSECAYLSSIIIPDTVEEIGSGCFESCHNLTSITLPQKLSSLDAGVFSGCINLASIDIPDSVTYIGGYAFAHCPNLRIICHSERVQNLIIGSGFSKDRITVN